MCGYCLFLEQPTDSGHPACYIGEDTVAKTNPVVSTYKLFCGGIKKTSRPLGVTEQKTGPEMFLETVCRVCVSSAASELHPLAGAQDEL